MWPREERLFGVEKGQSGEAAAVVKYLKGHHRAARRLLIPHSVSWDPKQ